MKDESYYDGNWIKNKHNGKGKYNFSMINMKKIFIMINFNGKGKIRYKNGIIYEGDYK